MFCSQCGESLAKEARFCHACGTSAEAHDSNGNPGAPRLTALPLVDVDETPGVVVRPLFIPSLALVQLLPIQLFMTAWGGLFFGGFSMAGLAAVGLDLPKGSTFLFFGTLFFFGIPALSFRAWRRTAEETEFRFFKHKLEYYEGFMSLEQKTINLADVQEVSLHRSLLQKKHGLGTVRLATRANHVGRRAFSGVKMTNIENADGVYRNVKLLIEKSRRAETVGRRAA